MKKMLFAFMFLFLVACSDTEKPTSTTQPSTEAPAQNVASENGKEIENTPAILEESATLTEEEATAIIQQLIDDLRDATENAGYETTIEALREAWAPYVTMEYFDSISESLMCDYDYCGAYYHIPNSSTFGWKRTVDFVSDDSFTTEAFVPNLGDSIGLYSTRQSMEVTRDDGVWKINTIEFEPEDIHLSEDEVIPYLAQIYDISITDFYFETMDVGEFQHGIYVFTHPEYNVEYFVDSYTGTMYERAFFEEFTGEFIE